MIELNKICPFKGVVISTEFVEIDNIFTRPLRTFLAQ